MTFVQQAVKGLLRLVTKTYFRKIVVDGKKYLPHDVCIFAGNHPSGLIDPLVLLTALPDIPMSSVAKHSLFSTPFVSFFLKEMRAVPVVKTYDASLPKDKQATAEQRQKMNEQMYQTVIDRMRNEGISIAIFPEGTCHSSVELKELKTGTATIALKVASLSDGKFRVPIVPIGLNYSTASGQSAHGDVLVDIGRPIHVTDQLLALFESGREGEREAAVLLTETLESHLRHVVVTTPDWTEELHLLCERDGLNSPRYQAEVDRVKAKVRCIVEINGKIFKSDYHKERKHETAKRMKIERESTKLTNELGETCNLLVPTAVIRQAARRAFFGVSHGKGQSVFGESDDKFIKEIRLARRIYKPDDAELTLQQHAALARNFMFGYLHTSALRDPLFQSLWEDVAAYDKQLTKLNVNDDYVSRFAINSDKDGKRLRQIREESRTIYEQFLFYTHNYTIHDDNLLILPVVRSYYIGNTLLVGWNHLHYPVTSIAGSLSERYGVDEAGDRSVVATVKIITTTLLLSGCYPLAGTLVYIASGKHNLMIIPFTVGVFGLTGVAAAYLTSWNRIQQQLHGSLQILTHTDAIDRLRSQRSELQTRIRMLVDKHAPIDQKGWWRRTQNVIVSDEMLRMAANDMVEISIPLLHNKRTENERAVLTYKQAPSNSANSTAMVWFPGWNDSFFHVHLLDDFIQKIKVDIFTLDLRRCGRARWDEDGTESTPQLLAHDTYNLRDYFEEIDLVMQFLFNEGHQSDEILSTTNATQLRDGAKRKYKNILFYGHSVGALVAALYGVEGQYRENINGFIFNSPLLSMSNLKWYERATMMYRARVIAQHQNKHQHVNHDRELTEDSRCMRGERYDEDETSIICPYKQVIQEGGMVSDYSVNMNRSYKFTKTHKSLQTLTITAGWASALLNVQEMLQKGELVLQNVLVLYTPADKELNHVKIDKMVDYLSSGRTDGKNMPSNEDLVERVIETSEWDPSCHDVLAAPSMKRVNEAMYYIEEWILAHTNNDRKDGGNDGSKEVPTGTRVPGEL
eukprot:CFRG4904T1